MADNDSEPKASGGISALVHIAVVVLFVMVSRGNWGSVAATLGFIVIALVVSHVTKRQQARAIAAQVADEPPPALVSSRAANPPLGQQYFLTIAAGGGAAGDMASARAECRVRVGERGLAIADVRDPQPSVGVWTPPGLIPLSGVHRIDVTAAAFIVTLTPAFARSVELQAGEVPAALVFVPRNRADRDRLAWEFAVRLPDAMEQGLAAGGSGVQ